jgi:hypothetical protein
MQTNINVSCDVDDDESCDHNNENIFEEEQEDILTNTMVQNIFFLNKYMIILKMM